MVARTWAAPRPTTARPMARWRVPGSLGARRASARDPPPAARSTCDWGLNKRVSGQDAELCATHRAASLGSISDGARVTLLHLPVARRRRRVVALLWLRRVGLRREDVEQGGRERLETVGVLCVARQPQREAPLRDLDDQRPRGNVGLHAGDERERDRSLELGARLVRVVNERAARLIDDKVALAPPEWCTRALLLEHHRHLFPAVLCSVGLGLRGLGLGGLLGLRLGFGGRGLGLGFGRLTR
eukprot:5552346-Prymnesium_polylepis.1